MHRLNARSRLPARIVPGIVAALILAGCRINIPPPGGGDGGNGDGGNGNGGNGGGEVPVVALAVSNTTPQLNEQVVLQCSIISGDDASPQFAYQGAAGRLNINPDTGRAAFIVSEADIGSAYRFTCTATTQIGTSDPSNEVTVTPTAAP